MATCGRLQRRFQDRGGFGRDGSLSLDPNEFGTIEELPAGPQAGYYTLPKHIQFIIRIMPGCLLEPAASLCASEQK